METKNIYTAYYKSPIGWLRLKATDTALIELSFSDGPVEPKKAEEENETLRKALEWLEKYFSGKAPSPNTLPLDPGGSEFARRVYTYLMEIPYGSTTTYGTLASKIAKDLGKERMSAQAVGGAIARNPIAIIIPCHRVIGADSKLRGFAGGLPAKASLLEREGVKVVDNSVIVPKESKAERPD